MTATLYVPERLIKMRKKEKTETDSKKLPVPVGWRLLIMPYEAPSTTKGGIEIPDHVVFLPLAQMHILIKSVIQMVLGVKRMTG